jgi:ABC-type transporter MlaC component
MNRWICTCILMVLLAISVGCKKQANDQDAIRTGIDKHLSEQAGLNLSAMDREVKQVVVNGDHANAQVEFRVKGGDARMEIEYTMERQGGEWKVLNSQPMAGQEAHPGMQASPGAPDSGGNSLPQGHPPVH